MIPSAGCHGLTNSREYPEKHDHHCESQATGHTSDHDRPGGSIGTGHADGDRTESCSDRSRGNLRTWRVPVRFPAVDGLSHYIPLQGV
jgi:hypothetical protein